MRFPLGRLDTYTQSMEQGETPQVLKVVLFGGSGLVGNGIMSAFSSAKRLPESQIVAPRSSQIDLENMEALQEFLEVERPDCVIMAAGRVGGIAFNIGSQVEQYRSNLLMNFNLIEVCARLGIQKLLLISSSCIYPMDASVPLQEEHLFDGLPHPTNEGYAAAKSVAIRHLLIYKRQLALDWMVLIPTNVYGVRDETGTQGHVIPQLVTKFMDAKLKKTGTVEIWGDGSPIREFLFNEDLGRAVLELCHRPAPADLVNVSSGEPISIRMLAEKISEQIGYEGEIVFDSSKPNGHPNKSMDGSRLRDFGWKPNINLDKGLELVISSRQL